MGISETKKQIVIDNYFKNTCDVNTSIKEAFTKGFEVGLTKAVFPKRQYETRLKADMVAVFDKIRAEILEEKECAYADFEQYKAEYLGQDWEDVYDSLPQDDFRYGMERCIEIINKYRAESEKKDADSN